MGIAAQPFANPPPPSWIDIVCDPSATSNLSHELVGEYGVQSLLRYHL